MEKHCTHLSIEERTMIRTRLSMEHKPAWIAREMERSAATPEPGELKRAGGPRAGVIGRLRFGHAPLCSIATMRNSACR